MSLANLLFKPKSADGELDDIFKSSAGGSPSVPPPAPAPAPTAAGTSKRKPRPVEDDEAAESNSRKRAKHDKQARKRVAEADSSDDEPAPPPVVNKKKPAKHEKAKKKRAQPESDSEDDVLPPAQPALSSDNDDDRAHASSGSDSDDDDDAPPPKHISLTAGVSAGQDGSTSKGKKAQYTPAEETSEQRDARTVFVGNLPIEVAKNRSARKQLIRHLASFVPNSKVESIRFRSVAFQNPTSEMPMSDDEDEAAQKRRRKQREEELSVKEKRGKERAAAWRDDQDQEPNDGKKQYLTPAEKKKIAFIHKEFHADADTTNAYAVFAYPKLDSDAVAPDEAARLCVEKGDGSSFMERTIRVDRVGAGVASAKTDARRSIFVGNLDFAAKEEDLRVFFESLLTTERGAPSAPEGQDAEQARWVTHVRLVRDAATQLGKGFAYVEFADRECVDEVLALDQVRLKFAKRKLRVQKCKAGPSASAKAKPTASATPAAKHASSSKKPILDPSHFVSAPKKSSSEYAARAAELAGLPKDARKAAKAADADRLARRMEKKQKKRMALGAGAAEAAAGKGGKGILGKKKTTGGTAKPKPKVAKGRIRSEKSMAKRNAKK